MQQRKDLRSTKEISKTRPFATKTKRVQAEKGRKKKKKRRAIIIHQVFPVTGSQFACFSSFPKNPTASPVPSAARPQSPTSILVEDLPAILQDGVDDAGLQACIAHGPAVLAHDGGREADGQVAGGHAVGGGVLLDAVQV
jgi:hypothetical protein